MHINAYLSQLGYSSLYSNSLLFSKNRLKRGNGRRAFRSPQGLSSPSYGYSQTVPPPVIKTPYHWSYVFAFFWSDPQTNSDKDTSWRSSSLRAKPYPVRLTLSINIQRLYDFYSYSCQQLLPFLSKKKGRLSCRWRVLLSSKTAVVKFMWTLGARPVTIRFIHSTSMYFLANESQGTSNFGCPKSDIYTTHQDHMLGILPRV